MEKQREEGILPDGLKPVFAALGLKQDDLADIQIGSVIYANKPGDGSAREQAASCQRVLGGCANICLEFATKRYRSNCVNWGILPFTVESGLGVSVGDFIYVPDVRSKVENGDEAFAAKLVSGEKKRDITLYLKNTTAEERELLLTGCLMNHYAAQNRSKNMKKISMPNPIAELDGDEMTRIIWAMIKDELIKPFVELNTEYYDLSIQNRENTKDQVTVEAAEAIKRLKLGVKCATITPNLQRQQEYHLTKLWRSPNATIRAALDGTVFRAPILISKVKPVVSCWKRPITIARHAYGDIYRAVEYRVECPGKAELLFTDENGRELSRQTIFDFKGPGVLQAMHNRDDSILSFARCCFSYALDVKQDVWFSTKDTISKDYDQTFKLLFQKVFDEEYSEAFEQAGLRYRYALIDDVAAKVIRSEGGIIWACKNYDGDVMSDLIAAASGSLPMMTSVLVSPDGCFEYEAAHGTVVDHYQRHLKGEKVSTNPLATIAAWEGALKKRGELDGNTELVSFAEKLGRAGIEVFEEGYLSEDLAALCDPAEFREMPDNERLMGLIREKLTEMMQG